MVEAYAKEQGLFHRVGDVEPVFSELVALDLSTVEPSLAGPVHQDRVSLSDTKAGCRRALAFRHPRRGRRPALRGRLGTSRGRHAGRGGRRPRGYRRHHDCTNTSNPQVMLAAGLLAQKAVARGLRFQPWVVGAGWSWITTSEPGSAPTSRSSGSSSWLRVHHLHGDRPSAARRVRGGARRRPERGGGAVGQPQLRGPHPPRTCGSTTWRRLHWWWPTRWREPWTSISRPNLSAPTPKVILPTRPVAEPAEVSAVIEDAVTSEMFRTRVRVGVRR